MARKPQGQVVRSTQALTDGTVTLRLLGVYYLSEEDPYPLIEVLIQGPWYRLREFDEFRLYTTPDWSDPPAAIRPQFFLDPTGEQLIGSYLNPPAAEDWPQSPAAYRRQVTYRFASFWPELTYGALLTPLGLLPEMEWEPIPERLLRLIWLDA
jgi:hypothetical protein